MAATLAPLPFEEAIRAFARRGQALRTTDGWRDMWKGEHAAAFTVARSAGFDVLKDIHNAMLAALQEGKTFEAFAKELRPVLEAKGWWGKVTRPDGSEVQLGSMRRLRLIYDTNMRVSHAAGRWEQIQRTAKLLPYLRYSAVLDRRTRPMHRHWHDTVLPVADAWWATHFPPNGWNCRCTVVQLTRRQAVKAGVTEPAPSVPPRRWFNPKTGQTEEVPGGIDPGWDYNPGAAAHTAPARAPEVAARQLADKLVEAPPALAAAVPTPAIIQALAADFARWVDDLDAGRRASVARYTVGTLSAETVAWLEARGMAPQSGAVTVTQAAMAHLLRDAKRARGQAVPVALVRRLPELLASPRAVLRDRRDGALLYVFDVPGGRAKAGKLVVRLDFQERAREPGGRRVTITTNALRSASIVGLQALADVVAYELIQGQL